VTCPVDVKQPNGFECRAAAGPCDVAEQVSLFVSTIISIYYSVCFHPVWRIDQQLSGKRVSIVVECVSTSGGRVWRGRDLFWIIGVLSYWFVRFSSLFIKVLLITLATIRFHPSSVTCRPATDVCDAPEQV